MIRHSRLSQLVPRTNPASLAVFVAVAAAVNVLSYAVADEIAVDSSGGSETAYHSEQSSTRAYDGIYSSVPPTDPTLCPKFGCPLLPRDIAFDDAAKGALESVRALKAAATDGTAAGGGNANDEDGEPEDETRRLQQKAANALDFLRSAGETDKATLTLVGYKGGNMEDQTNQDRAFVVSPYHVALSRDYCPDENPQDAAADKKTTTTSCQGSGGRTGRLLGVFDGHGPLGELVSDHTVTNLPDVLAAKLEDVAAAAAAAAAAAKEEEEEEDAAIKRALFETFLEMDKSSPPSASGGCTATVILQIGKRAYVANAGDSRSFLATYTKSTGTTKVVYASREDKPNLPDEKARVERMGGRVYIPDQPGRTSRVMYRERYSGSEYGLAMSRSIGDWDAGKVGVIPDPIVDVVDLESVLVEAAAARTTECAAAASEADGGEEGVCAAAAVAEDGDVEVFAVSATDGLLDYVAVEDIAEHVATGLYVQDGPHPLLACEELIGAAAGGWHQARKGRYRDDIAIAVTKMNF